MERTGKFIRDALPLALAGIVLRALSVSFNAYVSKKLGAEAMGLYGLVMSVGTFAITLASSGVNLAAVRLTAAALSDRDCGGNCGTRLSQILRKCVTYALFFGIGSCVLLLTMAGVIGRCALSDARTIPALRAFALSLPAISVSAVISGYFTGVRHVPRSILAMIMDQLMRVLFVIAGLVMADGHGSGAACLALVLGNVAADAVSLVWSWFLCRLDIRRFGSRSADKQSTAGTHVTGDGRTRPTSRAHAPGDGRARPTAGAHAPGDGRTRPNAAYRRTSLRDVANISLPVALGSYLRQGLTSLEHIAIPWGLRRSGRSPEAALASYGVVSQMALPVVMFPYAVIGAFTSLLVPEMTTLAERGDTLGVRQTARRVISTTVFFGLGIGGVFSSFASQLGMSIYSSAEAGDMIRLLAPAMPMMFLDTTVDAMLKGLGEQVYCVKVNTLDAAICLITVVLAVPRMGIYGYIAVIYASEAVNAALSISRLASITSLGSDTLGVILLPMASLFASGFLWHTLSSFLPALSPAVGIVVYALTYLAVGCVLWLFVNRGRSALRRSRA